MRDISVGSTRMAARRTHRLHIVVLAVVGLLVSALLTTVADPSAAPARAAGPLEVDSVVWNGGPDAVPGDGICLDAGGRCTLRAALHEANTLGGSVIVTVAAAFAGGTITVPDCTTTQYMATTGVPGTTTAFYAITAPDITLDLQNKISLSSPDCAVSALYVNGANAIVQNISSFFSGGPSLTVGGSGDGAVLANLTLQNVATNFPELAVAVSNGADNVTVRDSVFSGFTAAAVTPGTVYVLPSSVVNNLRITGNRFTNDLSTTTCSSVNGRGCRRSGITVGAAANVTGLVIQSNRFENFTTSLRVPIPLGATTFTLSGLDISANQFATIDNPSTTASATVSLPLNTALGGTNTIRENTFVASAESAYAIYWDGIRSVGSTIASNVTISDNYFDRYGTASLPTIGLTQTGTVTVQRNTFGPASLASTGTSAETANNSLVAHLATSTNRDIQGWYPSGTPTVNTTACTMTFTATKVASGTAPTMPARLDVYWSSGVTSQGAEVFLGSHTAATTAAQTVTVPYTSNAAGRIRIQTVGAAPAVGGQLESSQYSRVLNVAATTCRPALTVDQAVSQSDPTSTREIRFTVTSSSPLAAAGAGSLETTDFSTAGSTAAGVQVTAVTRISPTRYDVVATANDTGTVVLSLPVGTVADANNAASTNTAASTSTDNSVTFQNPLSRTPAALTVYQGAPSELYTVTRAGGAPPTSPISIAIAPSTAWATAPTSLTLASAASSGTVAVTSAADLGGLERTAVLSHSVTSLDSEYNGLLVPAVEVTAHPAASISPTSGPTAGGQSVAVTVAYLPATVTEIRFGTDVASFSGTGGALAATSPAHPSPTGIDITVDVSITYANGTVAVLPGAYTYVPQPAVSITKTAYSDAARTQQVPSGGDVLSGQTVYWTYTVSNPGETPLTAVTVTDPQLPAGAYPGGLVCQIPSLAIGATTSCTADAVVGP